MTTLTPFSKASITKSAVRQSQVDSFFRPHALEWLPAQLQKITELRRVALICHLIRHLWAYTRIGMLLEQGLPLDKLQGSREFIRDAGSLAAELSCIPNFKTIEPLREAHRVLTEHWRTVWSTGGVSETEYRARLKGAILFVLGQCQDSTAILSPKMLIEHLCEPLQGLCGVDDLNDKFPLYGRKGDAQLANKSAVVFTDVIDRLASDCFIDAQVKSHEGEPSNAGAKEYVSELWDRQTRGDMEEPELERLVAARRLFREGNFQSARETLTSTEIKHAESFNLLGVIYESEGNFDEARKCYGSARSLDKDYMAAHMNGCRVYELYTFGHSSIPMYL